MKKFGTFWNVDLASRDLHYIFDYSSEPGVELTKFWKRSLKVAQQLLGFIVDFYTF